jgi:Sensors of blue-light using FAD
MPPITHLIYASVATEDFKTAQLTDLLQQARQTNETLGVTGTLLYSDGSFFQVLEGESAVVEQLYQNIMRDERHEQCTLIIKEPIARRSFGNWSMGFSHVSPEELTNIAGLNDFFHAGSCFTQLDVGRAKKLLAAFAGGSWRTKRAKATGA